MTRTMSLALLVAFCALATGCSAIGGCDPDGAARDLAGEGATDCGFATNAEERALAVECAERELAAGRPFVMGYRRIGRDSEVRTYLAADAEGVWILGYDGGVGGSGANLTAFRCTAPPARTTTIDGEVLTCPSDGTMGLTICSR